MGPDDPGPRAIFFLKRVEPGLYEPTVLRVGLVPIVGDRIPEWNCTLTEGLARMRRAIGAQPKR
jgi:hypothetical protein